MTTVAPRSVSHSMVGSAARIRKSSVIAAVVVERHVEVGADQDPLAAQIAERRLQILECRDGGSSLIGVSA